MRKSNGKIILENWTKHLGKTCLNKYCAFTGHRKIDEERLGDVKAVIRRGLREKHKIYLETALPYPGRAACPDPEFRRLLESCNTVGVHAKAYFPRCFMVRNEFMVKESSRLIAVFDGRERTGTGATIRFARVRDLDVHIIEI